MAGFLSAIITIVVLVGLAILLFGMKPDCPAGTVGVFYQYSGWACVAGASP